VSGFLKVHGPAAAMAAFLFAISSFPSLEPPELLGFSPGDKLFHGLVYAVFGFLLLRSVRALMNGAGRQAATATGTGIFYGLTDESDRSRIPRGLPSTRRHIMAWSRTAGPRGASIGRPEACSFWFQFFWMIGDRASGRSDGSDSPPLAASINQISCDTPLLVFNNL
jgi:hypothetical protein